MAVLIAIVALVTLYVGIWWAISRIPTRPKPWTPPARHMTMQHPDRLRMDLHTDKDMDA
jgi:hypothetical protein